MNRPVCAGYISKDKKGKLIAIGSSKMINDQYIDK